MKTTCASMDIISEDRAVIQHLNKDWYHNSAAAIDMLRLDLIHPIISGNKWYKLKHNLKAAKAAGAAQILTFGGAYSNHLIAAAAAAKEYGIPATGVVRGLYAKDTPTLTLTACTEMGMTLVFVSKEDYNKKTDPIYLQQLQETCGSAYIIPEGGANQEGRLGSEDIAQLIPVGYTHVCVSIGTGTTFIGLRNALPASVNMLGFAPFKYGAYLKDEVATHLNDATSHNWDVYTQYNFGGFGKWNSDLLTFMNEFYDANKIPLDMVYTAKMMYGIKEMLSNGAFGPEARILCVHTGGLQGNSAVQQYLVYETN